MNKEKREQRLWKIYSNTSFVSDFMRLIRCMVRFMRRCLSGISWLSWITEFVHSELRPIGSTDIIKKCQQLNRGKFCHV